MAPEALPDIPEVVNYITPDGRRPEGVINWPPRVYPVMPKEPWVNLFVARATRRIPPALTGCVLTHTAWERTGAASGAVASHL